MGGANPGGVTTTRGILKRIPFFVWQVLYNNIVTPFDKSNAITGAVFTVNVIFGDSIKKEDRVALFLFLWFADYKLNRFFISSTFSSFSHGKNHTFFFVMFPFSITFTSASYGSRPKWPYAAVASKIGYCRP